MDYVAYFVVQLVNRNTGPIMVHIFIKKTQNEFWDQGWILYSFKFGSYFDDHLSSLTL